MSKMNTKTQKTSSKRVSGVEATEFISLVKEMVALAARSTILHQRHFSRCEWHILRYYDNLAWIVSMESRDDLTKPELKELEQRLDEMSLAESVWSVAYGVDATMLFNIRYP